MRFYLDENLSQQIAIIARRLGVDVTSAQELRHRGIDDEEQLAHAVAAGRCFVTRDYKDFAPWARLAPVRGIPHAGILFVAPSLDPQRYAVVAEALARFDAEHREGIGPYGSDWLK